MKKVSGEGGHPNASGVPKKKPWREQEDGQLEPGRVHLCCAPSVTDRAEAIISMGPAWCQMWKVIGFNKHLFNTHFMHTESWKRKWTCVGYPAAGDTPKLYVATALWTKTEISRNYLRGSKLDFHFRFLLRLLWLKLLCDTQWCSKVIHWTRKFEIIKMRWALQKYDETFSSELWLLHWDRHKHIPLFLTVYSLCSSLSVLWRLHFNPSTQFLLCI